jgi:HEPN domain-containing protein
MTQNGNPAVQAPPRSGSLSDLLREIDREAEARRSQSEILEFIQEALEKPEEPASVPLSADEASRLDLAKAGVNEVVRKADSILGRVDGFFIGE